MSVYREWVDRCLASDRDKKAIVIALAEEADSLRELLQKEISRNEGYKNELLVLRRMCEG